MKVHVFFLAILISLTSAVPIPNGSFHQAPVKRGLFDNLSHFPFLASSSSAHGSSSSSSSSSSSDDYGFHDSIPDYHSHVIHHPEVNGHHGDFLHGDHNVAVSYQNQYFGHDSPTSYQHQHVFDNHLSAHDDQFSDFNKYEGVHDSLLEYSHLDAPEYGGDYKNYGGDLGEYSHHAGLLAVSSDHKIDHLLDPFSPSHSSYDSY